MNESLFKENSVKTNSPKSGMAIDITGSEIDRMDENDILHNSFNEIESKIN